VERVKESEAGIGFDVVAEEYRDMVKAGIIDPTKVTRPALQHAASIVGMLLTMGAVVVLDVVPQATSTRFGKESGKTSLCLFLLAPNLCDKLL